VKLERKQAQVDQLRAEVARLRADAVRPRSRLAARLRARMRG